MIHPLALGVPKTNESPFVRELPGGRLSIFRVLLDPGSDPVDMEIRSLPRDHGNRPKVYCPFCGRLGKYSHTDNYFHFSHLTAQDECSPHDLETILHRRAKDLLLQQIEGARAARCSIRAQITCARCSGLFSKPMCRADSWDSEASERTLPSGLRPDITLFNAGAPVFLIEVYATHLVDVQKRAALTAAGFVGLEIDARSLFDDHGDPTYRYSDPLPLPRSTWNVELQPRSYNICKNCRRVSPETSTAAALVEAVARLDPTVWHSMVAASGFSSHWRTALLEAPGQTLVTHSVAPEKLRDKYAVPAHDLTPSIFLSRLFAGLSLHFGDPAKHWSSIVELARAPFKPLIEHIERSAADISGHVESLSDDDDNLQDSMDLADFVHRAMRYENDEMRARAWMGFALLRNSYSYGNTNMNRARLLKWPVVQGVSEADRERWIGRLEKENFIVTFSDESRRTATKFVALRVLAEKEYLIVAHLKRLKARPIRLKAGQVDGLNREQTLAVKQVEANTISIVHGAAGTGKSRVIAGVIAAFPNVRWLLLAPTGKAAGRLRQLTAHLSNCSTPITYAKFVARDDTHLEREQMHGVILDEAGFVSVEGFETVLRALNRHNIARLVLAGDHKQLPSIGPGDVLGDLIKWAQFRPREQVSRVELRKVMRSNDELAIAAHAVRQGKMPAFAGPVVLEEPAEDLMGQVISAVRSLEDGVERVQVIGRTRKLVEEMNAALQANHNRSGRPLNCNENLRIGDAVLCTENYYGEVTLLNGQQAEIVSESEEAVGLLSEGETLKLPVSEISRIALGYAFTIHKAQGSEWGSVVIVLPGPPPIRTGSGYVKRPLIYTALTRSKHRVHIIAQEDTLCAAIQSDVFRKTSLWYFLGKYWSDTGRSPTPPGPAPAPTEGPHASKSKP